MTATLTYGFDPLCGWCYGFVPAMRRLRAARPEIDIRLALPGLVTDGRVGPYAEMEGYIRGASERLRAVTGRAPTEAFFDMIRRPGVLGRSAPPCLVLARAREVDADGALGLAHAMIEAHFERGADYNDPSTYPPLLEAAGLEMEVPDLEGDASALWARERRLGITSFPTLIANGRSLPVEYDPDRLVALVDAALSPRPA
jgi:putative protein-disulfide isomerase